MKGISTLAAGLATLLIVSCAPSTPAARIQANPAVFENLSPAHRELVRQGRLENGMSPDAVYIAWGRPAREFTGSEQGVSTRRWDYADTQAVFTDNTFGPGRASSWGGYHRYDFTTQVTHIPYRRASVWFHNDRVTGWEQSR